MGAFVEAVSWSSSRVSTSPASRSSRRPWSGVDGIEERETDGRLTGIAQPEWSYYGLLVAAAKYRQTSIPALLTRRPSYIIIIPD